VNKSHGEIRRGKKGTKEDIKMRGTKENMRILTLRARWVISRKIERTAILPSEILRE
jgi:hypothetical protein